MSRTPRKRNRTVPLVEERPTVVKSKKTHGRIQLKKRVREQEAEVDEPLRGTEYDIRRVPRDMWVDEPVPVRTEGATTIYPILREIAFITKRLKLVEEVHVTRRERVRRFTDSVSVKREEITVEQTEAERDADDKPDADHDG